MPSIARKRLRQLVGWVYGFYAWVVFGLTILFVSMLVTLLGLPSYGRPVARAAARLLFRLAGIHLSVRGLHLLPHEPHILLVNHTSFLDGIALTALLPAQPGYAFTVKQQYPSQVMFWPLLRGIGTLVLQHSAPQQKSANIARLVARLRSGDNLIVFPEGGFVPEAGLRPFHSGAFIAAATAGVPVVIAALRGARCALRPRTWLLHRMPIELEIGSVLMPHAKDATFPEPLMHAAREAMLPLTDEHDAAGQTVPLPEGWPRQ